MGILDKIKEVKDRLFETAEEKSRRMRAIISAREMGPNTLLSVGTAMVFDCEGFDPKKWEKHLYANVRTLYRNFLHAIPKAQVELLDEEDMLQPFLEEMEMFASIVEEVTRGQTEVTFYLPDYKDITRLLPQCLLRSVKTEKQRQSVFIEEALYKLMRKFQDKEEKLAKENKEEFEPLFIECGSKLPKGKGPALILTHYPTDLLSASQFPLLKLLESHTGKIKVKREWASKLTGKPELLSKIPFCRFTVQICGDGNNLVASAPIKIKQYLEKLATDNDWSNTTTEDRVRFGVGRIRNPQDRMMMSTFL